MNIATTHPFEPFNDSVEDKQERKAQMLAILIALFNQTMNMK